MDKSIDGTEFAIHLLINILANRAGEIYALAWLEGDLAYI